MINQKYTPSIGFTSGILHYLSFKINDIVYTIENGDSSMIENETMDI